MSGWIGFWSIIVILCALVIRGLWFYFVWQISDLTIDDRKSLASNGYPSLSEPAIIQDKRESIPGYLSKKYYFDFWLQSSKQVISCEVSKSLYDRLNLGYSGILTYQGTAFQSFKRNGEVFCEKH